MKPQHLLPFLLLFFTCCSYAQEEKKPTLFAIGAGVGFSGMQHAGAQGSAGIDINGKWNTQFLGARFIVNKEPAIWTTAHKAVEGAVYWGKYLLSDDAKNMLSFGIGPSLGTYYLYGRKLSSHFGTVYQLVPHSTFGFALDVQAGVNFGPHVGLGLHCFASINPVATLAGALLCLRIGTLQ